MPGNQLIPTVEIERRIYLIRGQRVMLDRDLAELYGVTTAGLNQAVKRNSDRFPDDFMFQLDNEEFENWISQIVISNPHLKMGARRHPLAFTEQGVAMLFYLGCLAAFSWARWTRASNSEPRKVARSGSWAI